MTSCTALTIIPMPRRIGYIPSGPVIALSSIAGACPETDVDYIWVTDVLNLLRHLPTGSVNCVVTSPPYWNLRDYQMPGQMGSEPTPQAYVEAIVCLFRELRRVLRDDGTIFLNLGDSYVSNARRATSCDTSDKAPEDYQGRDCLCENLCDVCRVVYRNHKVRNAHLLVAMLVASLSATNHEHKALQTYHFPTSDLLRPTIRSVVATLDQEQTSTPVDEQLRASLVSMLGGSYPQLLDECLQRHVASECLLCGRSLPDSAQESADKSASRDAIHSDVPSMQDPDRNIFDRVLIDDASAARNEDKICDFPYPDYTASSRLPPKSMALIPFRVAIALQDDGWILRSDIIWSKPNPMTESVRDRPTKSHEYVFLITKKPKYWCDMEAIKEPATEATIIRITQPNFANQTGGDKDYGRTGVNPNRSVRKATENYARKNERLGNRRYDGFNERYDAQGDLLTRNKRSVWEIPTEPNKFDHFATFPRALIEPMILAGCPDKVCSLCGGPWVRCIEKGAKVRAGGKGGNSVNRAQGPMDRGGKGQWDKGAAPVSYVRSTTGWQPTCTCNAPHVPGLVLDPFTGSGTTALVARANGRHFIGCDLNPSYVSIARERLRKPFEQHYVTKDPDLTSLPLFAYNKGD